MPDTAPVSISAADGAEIRPLASPDLPLMKALYLLGGNAAVAGSIDLRGEDGLAAMRAEQWATPMALLQDDVMVGGAVIAAADSQHLNGRLVVLAREPRQSLVPVALYIRHVFWSYPLHRLYALLPRSAASHAQLLQACGFVSEGRLLAHLRVGGRRLDLDVFGLLRPEFDAWCRANHPGWALY